MAKHTSHLFTPAQIDAIITAQGERIAALERRLAELVGDAPIDDRSYCDPPFEQPTFTFSDPVPPLSEEDKAFIREQAAQIVREAKAGGFLYKGDLV